MASVVYVTDPTMIENHRLRGAEELNFWRPMSQTRMKKFFPGDLIFFLTRVERKKEKGIVGYGEYVREERLSLNRMWKKYEEKNGYPDKESLVKAIHEYTEKIPSRISCLYVDHVVFFKAPVFLSEVGIQAPLTLESYMYLDHGKSDAAFRILKKGRELGTDLWASAVANSAAKDEWIERDLVRSRLSAIQDHLKAPAMPETAEKENRSVVHALGKEDPAIRRVSPRGNACYKIESGEVTVYLPMMIGGRDQEKVCAAAGYACMWAACTRGEKEYAYEMILKKAVAEKMERDFLLPGTVRIRAVKE